MSRVWDHSSVTLPIIFAKKKLSWTWALECLYKSIKHCHNVHTIHNYLQQSNSYLSNNSFHQSERLLLKAFAHEPFVIEPLFMEPAVSCWTWWCIGRVKAFQPEGCGFESCFSRHIGTLGKSLTHSCLWRICMKLRTVSVLCQERF